MHGLHGGVPLETLGRHVDISCQLPTCNKFIEKKKKKNNKDPNEKNKIGSVQRLRGAV